MHRCSRFRWRPSLARIVSVGLLLPTFVDQGRAAPVDDTARPSSAAPATGGRAPVAIPTRSRYVGTNVGGIAYYGDNFPFADLMKSGGGWSSSDKTPFPSVSATGDPTALKPGQRAAAAVAWNGTHYPRGSYTVLWDGSGSIGFPMSRVKIVDRGPHRIVVEPADHGQMWVGIDQTDPADPVRNVRFLLPGTERSATTQPFNPTFLERLAPFSVLRFMDWGATNGSSMVEWADRALSTDANYTTPRGVPIEVMIDLANTLHVDPWFCIPHKASDDYVRQFATLLHNRLDPALRPHVEYSNEVWNVGFSQTTWAAQQSDEKGLAKPFGLPSIFYARRAVQIFKIMRQVWGTDDAKRLVRVLAGQAAWTQFIQDALADADTAENVDAIAIAPYFGARAAGRTANVEATLQQDADAIVDQMLADVRGPVRVGMTANAAIAKRHGLRLLGYEGGPGDTTAAFPADKQEPMLALFRAAHASPRMEGVFVEYYAQWIAAGGDTLNQYVDISGWGKYGLWGALEYTFQDPATAPKYQGLMSVIAAHPAQAGRGR